MPGPEGFRLMGIVNVTPDSFSDGGCFLEARAGDRPGPGLFAEGGEMAGRGGALVSGGGERVAGGGESKRRGAEPVSAEEERDRVQPVIEGLAAARTGAQISIDTSKAAVARAALSAGGSLVNDVSALRADPETAGIVADSGAECCLMHMLG